MKHKGPIITLAAGLVLAAILMVMNLSVTESKDLASDAGGTTAPATTAAATAAPTTAPTTAPAKPPTGVQVTFAGNAQGRDGGASVAIAVTDGHAVAYLCDGKRIEAWLQGTATNGELTLSGAGNASLTGSYDNGGASGEVAAAGQRFAFSVKVVKPPSGLYRATANVRGAQVVGGWIVQADGTQVGLMVVGGEVLEAPALNTTTNSVIVDGTPIEAEPVDGTGL